MIPTASFMCNLDENWGRCEDLRKCMTCYVTRHVGIQTQTPALMMSVVSPSAKGRHNRCRGSRWIWSWGFLNEFLIKLLKCRWVSIRFSLPRTRWKAIDKYFIIVVQWWETDRNRVGCGGNVIGTFWWLLSHSVKHIYLGGFNSFWRGSTCGRCAFIRPIRRILNQIGRNLYELIFDCNAV